MSTINYSDIASRLTTERLRSYTRSMPDLAGAIRLYDWNTAMSGALHEDLGRLEVIVRNAMDRALVRHGTKHRWPTVWYRRQQIFPGRVARRAVEDIKAARLRATRGGLPEIHGKVIAELNLGFWRYLCAKAYLTSLWGPALAAAFPHHPKSGDAKAVREDVEAGMQRMHFLRNRIAHHEPVHRRTIRRDLNQLQQLVGWICPESRAWTGQVSRSDEVLRLRPQGGGSKVVK